MQEAATIGHSRLSVVRTTAIILLYTIGHLFILLPIISRGRLMGLKAISDIKISLILSVLLILISIVGHYFPKLKEKFSSFSLICISLCILTISYCILSEPYGQWTIERFSDLGTGIHYEAAFRMEIVWQIAAINFFVALYLLNRVIPLKSFQNYAFLFLLLFYTVMYVDFAIQKMPRACECDYGPFEDIEDIVYSDNNFDENTQIISACYYKYRFMFIKFGHRCVK